MPGAFDELLTGSGTGGPGKLTPAQLQEALGLRATQQAISNDYDTGFTQWSDPSKTYDPTTDTHGFTLYRQHGWQQQGSGDAMTPRRDTALDQEYIQRVRAGTDGRLGDKWDLNGNYIGTYEAQDGGGRQFNQAALMFGGALGGMYAQGLQGANAGVTANDIAMMSANGMTDAQIAAAVGENAASQFGLAGMGTGVTYADTVALANATGTPTTTPGPNGTPTTTPATTTTPTTTPTPTNGLTWDKFTAGMKNMGLSVGDIAKLGLAAGLSRDVKAADMDPALVKAIEEQTRIAQDANDRATANDDYWKSTFAPRYLDQMDQQMEDGRRLTDFNMGLAKKYDDRYWNTTAKQQDAFYRSVDGYDTEATRSRIAGEAGATVEAQNSAAMQALIRQLNRTGVNPNSGVYASNARQFAQQNAFQKAQAMNMTREAARKEGMNMRAVAAGLGGNLTGASAGFAGQAGGASQLGMNGIQGAQGGFNANNANWNSTMSLGANALSNLGSLGMNLTNQNFQANAMNTQGFNQMLGYGLGMFGSSRNGTGNG